MAVMGFTFDPGPLPFTTIRDAKWANRLEGHDRIEIVGEHGCTMPLTMARVLSVRPYHGDCPPHLRSVYAGKLLCEIRLGLM